MSFWMSSQTAFAWHNYRSIDFFCAILISIQFWNCHKSCVKILWQANRMKTQLITWHSMRLSNRKHSTNERKRRCKREKFKGTDDRITICRLIIYFISLVFQNFVKCNVRICLYVKLHISPLIHMYVRKRCVDV